MRPVEEALPRRVEVPVLSMVKRLELTFACVVEEMAKTKLEALPVALLEVA